MAIVPIAAGAAAIGILRANQVLDAIQLGREAANVANQIYVFGQNVQQHHGPVEVRAGGRPPEAEQGPQQIVQQTPQRLRQQPTRAPTYSAPQSKKKRLRVNLRRRPLPYYFSHFSYTNASKRRRRTIKQ